VFTEEQGELEGAEPAQVSQRARERGTRQVGTLGAGNHFLELQEVEEIFEPESAQKMGLEKGQLTIMIHSGSRGFGFQICEDYVKKMLKAQPKYNISLPDKQLACAPFNSPEGRAYWGAMACAANYAWANRQCLMHWTRETIARVLKSTPKALGMSLVYDVAHNIGKLEEHEVEGKKEKLCVHRKGATRAFPPHHPAVPEKYKEIGQPVIIPGDMGSSSYVLCGTARAMKETFGSTCHGAGRVMSRSKAIRSVNSEQLLKELTQKGIYIRARGRKTLAEECPQAYKDIDEVVEIVHNAGLSKKVAKFKPLGVIKG
jgi:tRNA-splicing ligase RtcB